MDTEQDDNTPQARYVEGEPVEVWFYPEDDPWYGAVVSDSGETLILRMDNGLALPRTLRLRSIEGGGFTDDGQSEVIVQRSDRPRFLLNRPSFIEPHVWPGIRDYVWDGKPMGGFLHALFAGDVFRAAPNADAGNLENFGHMVKWIRIDCPVGSYGSYEKVEEWGVIGGLKGELERKRGGNGRR